MKTLVIYYSLEGNTKLIAETIAKETNADILELKTKKEYPTGRFKKYLWGGKSVLLNQKPDLLEIDLDPNEYDRIFIGTPIWVGTYAPPFNTFIENCNIENKKICLFACHGGGGAKKFYTNFKNKLPNNEYIGEIDFLEPVKKNTEESLIQVRVWINNLKS
ncbi:flavodoxin family protein [Clostridium vincentii]|uniref:Flavodoxin n=1 Tax=Clostridium vincentii TaxID=52704 RepID=A0A2T0BBT0_9CLOT|nr:flavodoxin [Clostridium vincentii]PRR81356.1 flavodoxin [Clostridium vincentii]